MRDWLDEIEAQIDESVPYYVPRLIAEIRRLRPSAAPVSEEWRDYVQHKNDQLPQGEKPEDFPADYILLVEGSIVHQNGIPVQLVTSAVVRANRANTPMLVGYVLASVAEPPVRP